MNSKFMNNHILRVFLYVLGVLITGLGINLLLKAELGAGAWDTVANNFSVLTNITIGTASGIINIIVLLLVFLYHRELKYLIIILPIIGIAVAIDFWGLIVFKDFTISLLWLRFIFFILGGLTITLGLALMIVTKYPAMVYDELTLTLMKVFKIKTFFNMRILIELFAIMLATIFGFWAGIKFGAVNLGSFFLAVALGPIITFHMRWLNKLLKTNKI